MNTIKNFSIFKKDNKGNEKLPVYTLSAKIDDEYTEIGAGWIKQGTKEKFISIKLSEAWVNESDPSKSRKGYVIVEEEALNKLLNGKAEVPPEVTLDDIGF